MLAPNPTRECGNCGKEFQPRNSFQRVCLTVRCAKGYATKLRKVAREVDKAKREKLKRIPDLIREAQVEFNAFVRARDRAAGLPCISSGRQLDWTGNGVDAGHYRSVGSASHLRFDERNCHAQSKHDNQWKSGNVVDYRIRLIERIGLEAVEALEADNTPHKWTRDELIAIRDDYRARNKAMKAQP